MKDEKNLIYEHDNHWQIPAELEKMSIAELEARIANLEAEEAKKKHTAA